jgi:hypothetical protein
MIAGHLGVMPLRALPSPLAATVLRDPAERAWSHYRALMRDGSAPGPAWRERTRTFADFLADPDYAAATADYQATWLAVEPGAADAAERVPGLDLPHPSAGVADRRPPDAELERRATATLAACAVVGTAERLDDVVDALARLLGRWLPQPPRLNGTAAGAGPPRRDAELVGQRSGIDLRLVAEAERRLDRTLATLPPLPPEPPAALPYVRTMADAFAGAGWHARVHGPGVGWHRWTGPGTTSTLRLPVRLAGRALLDVAIVSASDDDALRSLRLAVQDEPVPHRLEPREVGVSAIAEVDLDPARPASLTVSVDHTCHLVDPGTGASSPDPAGVAVGDVRIRSVDGRPQPISS